MKWAMYLGLDAVLTNDPEKYLSLRNHVPSEKDDLRYWPLKERWNIFLWSWIGFLVTVLHAWRYSGQRSRWKERLRDVKRNLIQGGAVRKI
jgi:hypothetical protein